MEKKLNGYKGMLTPQQIADGINAANKNANRLASDARILLDAGKYPSATSLAILSIEESGKVPVLRSLALANDEKEIAEYWREYRSHTKKNVSWILPELAAQGAKQIEDFRHLFDEASAHPHILDQLKQIGFYTDCLGRAHWSLPDEVIEKPVAESLVHTAEIFSTGKKVVPVREIELWIKHLKPVWKTSMVAMKFALVSWNKEMMENGFSAESSNMESFLNTWLL